MIISKVLSELDPAGSIFHNLQYLRYNGNGRQIQLTLPINW